MSDQEAERSGEPKTVRTFLVLLLLVLSGVPLVAYLWETVNQLLTLRVDPTRVMISVPVAGVLYLLWRVVGVWARSEAADRDPGSI